MTKTPLRDPYLNNISFHSTRARSTKETMVQASDVVQTTVVVQTPSDNLGDDIANTTVPAAIRQPSRKKKSFRWAPRDSLKSRNITGKPGSKRHQRYLNVTYLTDKAHEVDDEDWFVPENYRSPYSLFFTPENQKAWHAFIEASEEKQEELLKWFQQMGISDQDRRPKANPQRSAYQIAEHAFSRLGRDTRHCMRRHRETQFLYNLDAEILEYINGDETLMVYTFEDSSRRMICHGVCQFYSLVSRSITNDSGARSTHIYKPEEISVPTLSLMEYLSSL